MGNPASIVAVMFCTLNSENPALGKPTFRMIATYLPAAILQSSSLLAPDQLGHSVDKSLVISLAIIGACTQILYFYVPRPLLSVTVFFFLAHSYIPTQPFNCSLIHYLIDTHTHTHTYRNT